MKIKVVLQVSSVLIAIIIEAMLTEILFPILPELSQLFSKEQSLNSMKNDDDIASVVAYKISLLFSGPAWITVLMSPFIGYLIDVLSLNLTTIILLLIELASCLFYAFGNSYIHFLMGRICFNVLLAGIYTAASVIIIEVIEDDKTKSRLLAIPLAAYGLSCVGQLYTGNLYNHLGHQLTFLLPAGAVILCIISFLVGRYDKITNVQANIKEKPKESQSRYVIFEKLITVPLFLMVIIGTVRFSLMIILPISTSDKFEATIEERGNLWLPSIILFLITLCISVYIVEKFNVFITAGIFTICSSVSAFVLPFCNTQTSTAFIIAIPNAMEMCARYVIATFVIINSDKLARFKPFKGFIIGLSNSALSMTQLLAYLAPIVYDAIQFTFLCWTIALIVLFTGLVSLYYSYLYWDVQDEIANENDCESINLLQRD